MEDLVSYFDGHYLPKSKIQHGIDNTGFTRGYGVYECYRSYGRTPFRLNDHIKRLKYTCDNLYIEFPKEDFAQISKTLLEQNPDTEIIFRVYVIDHPKKDTYQLTILCDTPEFHANIMPKSFFLKTHIDNRENHFKTTSYSASIIATKKAKLEGFNGILYIGDDNLVHELSRANIFAVKDNCLFTPKSHCLEGITRLTILEQAPDAGYKVYEEDFHLDFLKEVDEVFATATIRGITPIAKINDLVFNSTSHGNHLQTYFYNLSYSSLQV